LRRATREVQDAIGTPRNGSPPGLDRRTSKRTPADLPKPGRLPIDLKLHPMPEVLAQADDKSDGHKVDVCTDHLHYATGVGRVNLERDRPRSVLGVFG
jgi:hypothetical protein